MSLHDKEDLAENNATRVPVVFCLDTSGSMQGTEGGLKLPFNLLRGDNKRLVIVPGATHCDLYDGGENDYIPFDELQSFFEENLA